MQNLAELERRAKAGEVDALTELGKRMLVGTGVPPSPQAGAELLHAAAEKGGAEACLRMAVLLAADAPPGQRWSQALDYLTRAAELGDTASRRQLALISSDPSLAAAMLQTRSTAEVNWSALRRSIRLDDWTQALPLQEMTSAPQIAVADSFLSRPICSWMIERAAGLLQQARTYDPGTGGARADKARTNRAALFEILEADVILLLVRLKIAMTVGVVPRALENSQVLHYAEGQEFRPHYDFLDPQTPALASDIARNGQRIATFLIYLNDDFDGGETDFPLLKRRFKGSAGGVLFFVSVDQQGQLDRRTLHAGIAPTRGQKWLFSQWIKSKAPLSL